MGDRLNPLWKNLSLACGQRILAKCVGIRHSRCHLVLSLCLAWTQLGRALQRTLVRGSLSDSRISCDVPFLVQTQCAETEPEQSSHTTKAGVGTRWTWNGKATTFIYDCKQLCTTFLFIFCTRLILGLGPQTKPPSMTARHGLVTSHCITLIPIGHRQASW